VTCAYPFFYFSDNVDKTALQALFDEYDTDRNGFINVNELEQMLVKIGVAPMLDPLKRGSASADRQRDSTAAQEQA
jgi:Ca2+-binding EF-hand superfamily protein